MQGTKLINRRGEKRLGRHRPAALHALAAGLSALLAVGIVVVLALVVAALARVGAQGAGLLGELRLSGHEMTARLGRGDAIEAGLDALGHHLLAGVLTDADDASRVTGLSILDASHSFVG